MFSLEKSLLEIKILGTCNYGKRGEAKCFPLFDILAWEQFKTNLIIGNGMYQFGFLGGMGKLEDPHNWLLAYLSGIGLLGLICFLLFLLSIVGKIVNVFIKKNIN
ncbi:hypothetical protein ACT4US_18855, partial [Bacillus sp. HC-Mk]